MKKYILITGGNFQNKGAQSMVFSTMGYISSKYPDADMVLLSTHDYLNQKGEKNPYRFTVLPWGLKTQLNQYLFFHWLLVLFDKQKNIFKYMRKELLKNTTMVFDISGFSLTSQFKFYHNIKYLLNLVVFKKAKIPVYLLPQSFGP